MIGWFSTVEDNTNAVAGDEDDEVVDVVDEEDDNDDEDALSDVT